MSAKVYDLFIEGETTGKKAAPEKVALDMKNLRIDGDKYFLLMCTTNKIFIR